MPFPTANEESSTPKNKQAVTVADDSKSDSPKRIKKSAPIPEYVLKGVKCLVNNCRTRLPKGSKSLPMKEWIETVENYFFPKGDKNDNNE